MAADTTSSTKGGSIGTDIKNLSASLFKTKRTLVFAYGFMCGFVAFTFFLAFSPSPNSYSPLFSNIFSFSSSASPSSNQTSVLSYFFRKDPSLAPNSTVNGSTGNFTLLSPPPSNNAQLGAPVLSVKNQTLSGNASVVNTPVPSLRKCTKKKGNFTKDGYFKPNQTTVPVPVPVPEKGKSVNSSSGVGVKVVGSNNTKEKQGDGEEDLVKGLVGCDLFDGKWVKDKSYPLYKPGSCSLIDEQFNCVLNGRPDKDYQRYKWKPKECTLPRLNPVHLLDMLRGKRLVFVGDSLNRNMWESLICILKGSVKNQRNVYEAQGRHHFKGEASYSFVFKDYGFTVEFFVSPFLVQEWEMPDKNGTKKETLRLDLVGRWSDHYKTADILIFNTGHWWTHDKTSKGQDYYQEGSHVYEELNVLEAFRRALTTWGRWVDAHINPAKSLVFFRGYSASHFSGGQWNSGGACDSEAKPIKNSMYLREYPPKMMVLERIFAGMKTHVNYLNVTLMTDFRKDGHPSIYRKQNLTEEERRSPLQYQDCSHWCLPGVPDAWNELLYAELLINEYQKQQLQKRHR